MSRCGGCRVMRLEPLGILQCYLFALARRVRMPSSRVKTGDGIRVMRGSKSIVRHWVLKVRECVSPEEGDRTIISLQKSH